MRLKSFGPNLKQEPFFFFLYLHYPLFMRRKDEVLVPVSVVVKTT